ncbi:MAG: hypothetical protein H7145_14995, partial [Akkermansiaceae bacterium]|nr:hypothetical protein [Armatimonadota bacterium]
MNKNECEARLRAAKPADDEIAPLSPEASARILCAALRANRRRGTFFWLAAPLRVIVSSLATAAAAYCLLPYINTSVMPVAEKPAPSPVITSATKNETASDRIPQAIREPSDRYIPPKLPALLPKPVKPPVMMAKSLV